MPNNRNEYMREYMRNRRAKLQTGTVNPGIHSTPSVAAPTPSVAASSEPMAIEINGWWLLAGVGAIGVVVLFATRMTPENKVKWLYTLAKSFHQLTSMEDTNTTEDDAA